MSDNEIKTEGGHWRIETDADRVAWLHLDQAESHTNVLSFAVVGELMERLDELERSNAAGLVILSDKANGFIAGADINDFTQLESTEKALELIQRGQQVMERIEQLPFATVALIHGFCLGGGLELALACRYRIAEDDPRTRLGLPEVRLGIHPGFGGSVRLIKRIGHLPAMELMLSGRSVSARAARRLGFVDYVVPRRQDRKSVV